MLNYNRIRDHFQLCEIERLNTRIKQLETELEAYQAGKQTTSIASPQSLTEATHQPPASAVVGEAKQGCA